MNNKSNLKMEEDNIYVNEINSELTGLNKGEKEEKLKKVILSITFGATFLIVVILIIILAVSGSKNSKNNDEKNKDEDIPTTPIIGEIYCIYDIQSITDSTILFGNEFIKNSEFDIYIDGKLIKYSKEYKFESIGNHDIQIKLYDSLNMDYMFKDIPEIISVEMKSEDNCEIISMISTFENCENLIGFNITGFNFEKLKSMKKLFYKSSLNKFNYDFINTSNLEDISYMFSSTPIIEISINHLNTNQVIDMSHLFEDCSSLLSINISDIDTSHVKDMSYMFHSCLSIKTLDISNFNTSQVINMSNMFQDCISLTEININILDAKNVEDMSFMFDGCALLNSLNISNFFTKNLHNMANMFKDCN